jgi:aldehyde dehydrogenase
MATASASSLKVSQQEGAQVLHGGGVEKIGEAFASGYYIQPTLLKGGL